MPPSGTPDPYAGFEPRIVPENITLLPKTASQVTGGNAWNERTIVAQEGRHIATILRELGATPDEIKAITAALGPRGRDSGLKEGQKLRILLAPARRRQRLQPVRVIVASDSAIEAVVALSDIGKYVVGRRRAASTASRPTPATTRRTTARACGSTRASTRPRCAIRCRAR